MVSWLLTECFVLFIVIDFIIYDFLLVSASVRLQCSMFHVPCLLSQCHVCVFGIPGSQVLSLCLPCLVCHISSVGFVLSMFSHLSSLSAVSRGQFSVAVLVLCFLVYFDSGGAYPRCHRVRSGVHPGYTSSLSQYSLSDFAYINLSQKDNFQKISLIRVQLIAKITPTHAVIPYYLHYPTTRRGILSHSFQRRSFTQLH